ncbi:MAG: ABC transporter permease [Evtepia gabavorous]
MNFLIRTYAWMTILQDTGIFNNFLTLLHLPNVHIIGTEAAVVIGMVYDYIPYMILPLYSIMAKMDEKLIEAARDLGCNGLGVLRRVIWPLSLPGVISGDHGADPLGEHLLHLPKAGRRQDHAHRRRD